MAGTNWHYKVIDKNDIVVMTNYSSLKKQFVLQKTEVLVQGWFVCVDRTSSFTNLHGKRKGKTVSKKRKKNIRTKVLVSISRKKEQENKREVIETNTHHSVYAIKRFFAKDGTLKNVFGLMSFRLILANVNYKLSKRASLYQRKKRRLMKIHKEVSFDYVWRSEWLAIDKFIRTG